MAADGWRSTRALSTQVRQDYAGFDYYQLVRLLLAERDGGEADRRALDSCVRFGADLSAAFPGREITRLKEQGGDQPVQLGSSNFCVAGVLGPLPEPFSEWLRERVREGDRAMLDFFDLFNHRLHTLRYLLKTCFNPGLNNRRPEDTDNAQYLAAIMGLFQPSLAAQLPMPKRALLAVAGLMADQRRSAAMIGNVLGLFLETQVQVQQLQGGWVHIEPEQRTALGRANSRLGQGLPLGRRVWDQQARVLLQVGPLSYAQLCGLLPGGEEHAGFVALVRHVTDRQVDCLVQLRLADSERPPRRLGSQAQGGLRLGYTSWAEARPLGRIVALFARLLAIATWADAAAAAQGRLTIVMLLVLRLWMLHAAAQRRGVLPKCASFLIPAHPMVTEVADE
jgi:type VI secretion system protein ImpH